MDTAHEDRNGARFHLARVWPVFTSLVLCAAMLAIGLNYQHAREPAQPFVTMQRRKIQSPVLDQPSKHPKPALGWPIRISPQRRRLLIIFAVLLGLLVFALVMYLAFHYFVVGSRNPALTSPSGG